MTYPVVMQRQVPHRGAHGANIAVPPRAGYFKCLIEAAKLMAAQRVANESDNIVTERGEVWRQFPS